MRLQKRGTLHPKQECAKSPKSARCAPRLRVRTVLKGQGCFYFFPLRTVPYGRFTHKLFDAACCSTMSPPVPLLALSVYVCPPLAPHLREALDLRFEDAAQLQPVPANNLQAIEAYTSCAVREAQRERTWAIEHWRARAAALHPLSPSTPPWSRKWTETLPSSNAAPPGFTSPSRSSPSSGTGQR